MSLVTLENVAVSLGARNVLHDVSLTIDRGEIVTIVGPNGSGKSTLLRTIIGAIKPSRGHVKTREWPQDRLRTAKTSYRPDIAHQCAALHEPAQTRGPQNSPCRFGTRGGRSSV